MLARFISSREDAKFLSNSHGDTKPQSFLFAVNFFRKRNRHPQISSFKKTSRLSDFARNTFAKIRGYSWFLFLTLRLGGFARKKTFPQPKPRERKIIHIKKKSFRTFYERERRRRTATNASPPIPANSPNADGSGISGEGGVGCSGSGAGGKTGGDSVRDFVKIC